MKVIYFVLTLVLLSSCGGGSPADSFGSGNTKYKITLSSTWSNKTHPINFPSNPHFSKLVGATHNVNTTFWDAGKLATSGIEVMAESGGTSSLLGEISTNISLGDSDVQILAAGIASSPGSSSFSVNVNSSHTFFTLVTMLAPSPDWFIGVSAYNLMPNGVWIDKDTVTLYAYDAGTDDGSNYTSTNADTSPKEAIIKITTTPFVVNNMVVPIAKLTIEKMN